MRNITTCPGLGDFIWVAQKLINANEQFKVIMSEGKPQRGHQLAEILPQLIAEHKYGPVITYNFIAKKNIQNFKKKWKEINEQSFYLSANKHVESGRRIEHFLPDLPTTYKLDYHTIETDKDTAIFLLPKGRKYIGIYTSAYSNVRNWGAWDAKEWFELIQQLNGKDVAFVLVGAPYDTGVTEDLIIAMEEKEIDYVNTIGQPLPVVIEMMKRFSYFLGFPSGLSILNETLGKDGLMFYAPTIAGIINTWADPERIRSGAIKECLFTDPAAIYKWLKDVYLIHDKL